MANLTIPNQKRGLPTLPKKVGTVAAYASLLCCAFPWIAWASWYLFHFPWLNRLTGFDFFKLMGVAVILWGISAACRVRIALVAVPVAVVMFFLNVYVMGS